MEVMFFDIGNVILFFSFDKMYQQIADVCGISKEEVYKELIENGLGVRYEQGDVSTEDVYQHFVSLSKKTFTRDQFYQAVADIFEPNVQIFPIIEDLVDAGIHLIAISNTCEIHYNYFRHHYSIFNYFDDFILSYKIGIRKPARGFYEIALNAANCLPNECFYVDDIEEYIEAAQTLGIDAKLYVDVPTLRTEIEARGVILSPRL